MSSSAVQTMADQSVTEKKDVKEENERLIIKFFGLERFFQEHQDES